MLPFDVRILDALIELIPIVSGAVIALAGAGLKHWLDRRESGRQRRRERLDRLMHLVYSLKPWTTLVDNRYSLGTSQDRPPSPIEEIEVIGNLHFDRLKPQIDAVVGAANQYQLSAMALGQERLDAGNKPAADIAARMKAPYAELLDSIEALSTKARELAKRLR